MYLIFDIGGSKMRVATSDDGRTFNEPKIADTPETNSELVAKLGEVARELTSGTAPTAVCGGLTRRRYAAREEIKKLFTGPVYLENDTALCGLGEAHQGAGRGSKILVYFTVSTGVGGVRLVDGQIDQNISGFEPGHQIINYLEPQLRLEDYISGPALQKKFNQPPRDITDGNIWDDAARIFAVGLHNTILHWSPDTVVIGGSMMKVPGLMLDDIVRHLKAILTSFPTLPTLKKANLGDFGGLHGALAYLALLKV
ncbi:MAG: ROK family protein [Candidatus Vogelbacteria bacterium]|nr:ROK family protein [Candidatus Vogelbacteria bacterium]